MLYPGVTVFEALTPYAAFCRVDDADVVFVAEQPGRVPAQGAKITLHADVNYGEVRAPDVIVVPGGLGIERLIGDEKACAWVREAHEGAQWTASVSTGSVLLAAAGVLEGEATTHWLATGLLEASGARPVSGRLVRDGRIVSAEGAFAALEMTLDLIRRLRGEATAAAVRQSLTIDELGSLSPAKPARQSTLRKLADPDPAADPPFTLTGDEEGERRGRRGRRRSGGGGRIEIVEN